MLRGVIITILFSLIGLTQASLASVYLSVDPVDGSSSLRFEKTPVAQRENKKEIHIRVNSTNPGRYQIFQRVLEPIVNEQGEAINLQAIETQTLPNSNSYGTLYLQNSDHLGMSDQLLYSSSQGGQSDMFIVGYALNPDLITSAGNFRGRLVFTVISNGASDQVTINVFLQTSPKLVVSIQEAHDHDRIHIRAKDTSPKTAKYLNVSISGNHGRKIRIYQEVDTMPQNESAEPLGAGVLEIDPEGRTDGLHIQGPTSLGPGRVLIYSSDKSEDNFSVYFYLNPAQIQVQDAGTYTGKIKYIVETGHKDREFSFDIRCDIPPAFIINVTLPPGGVSFTHVLANNPPQEKEVLVNVLSNLHKPYQVIQGLQTAMTNNQGKEFDNKYFTVEVQIPSGQKGQTDFSDFSPVQTGDYPVYSSDARGSGATFTVIYRLQGYAQMSAGDFTVPISFSLNQK